MGEYKAEFFDIECVGDVVVGVGVDVFAWFEDLDFCAWDEAFDGFLELVDEDDPVGDDEGLEADLGREVDGEGGFAGSWVEGEDDGSCGVEGGDDLRLDLVLDVSEGSSEGEVDGFAFVTVFTGRVEVLDGPGKGEDKVVLGGVEGDDGFLAGLGEAHELGFGGRGLDSEVLGDGLEDILGDI